MAALHVPLIADPEVLAMALLVFGPSQSKSATVPQLSVSSSPIPKVAFMAATEVPVAEDPQSFILAEIPAMAINRIDRPRVTRGGRWGPENNLQAQGIIYKSDKLNK